MLWEDYPGAQGVVKWVLPDLHDDDGQIIRLRFGSGKGGDGVGDTGHQGGSGLGFPISDDGLQAADGKLVTSFIFLLDHSVGEEGNDVAGIKSHQGVGELGAFQDTHDGSAGL